MSGKDPDETSLPELELLIAEFKQSGLRELHARCGELEVYLSQDADACGLDAPRVSVAAPVASAAPASKAAAPAADVAAPAGAPAVPDGAVVVTAPYLGTFYRAPKPGSPVYVDVGSVVTADTEICLVEVMKLFTAVRADVAGTVHAILATDGAMVEADQPLFAVIPG